MYVFHVPLVPSAGTPGPEQPAMLRALDTDSPYQFNGTSREPDSHPLPSAARARGTDGQSAIRQGWEPGTDRCLRRAPKFVNTKRPR